MASFGKHFAINIDDGKSDINAIKQGNNYRFTVLSERLIRLEYSKNGSFNDLPTDLVKNRHFVVPKFKVEEDDKYLVITTKYFSLQYLKENPFKGPSFAPDANLKVKLLDTDKFWYYGHPEARNYLASSFSLDDFKGGIKKLNKGLYSTDGFVTIDDTNTITYDEIGILNNTEIDDIDLYLFMYKRDFGLCLKDYFTLTGYPPLIPKYALGTWWYRDRIYNFEDIQKLIKTFSDNEVPLNVLLLGEFWHQKDKQNINLYKTGYTFNEELFPKPQELIDYLHKHDVFLGLNIDPYEGIRPDEPAYKEFASELDHKTNDNIPFRVFNKIFMVLYFQELINPLTKYNVDFFWIDYKKEVMTLRALVNYHIRDFQKSDTKRPMLLARNTGVSAHNNCILYSGETVVSWNTLKYLPFYNSSASNIGLSWWSHDIGGFKDGIEDAELYMRYLQFATFSPIFRLSAKRGIYYKREPWMWDFKTFNIVKDYMQLRQKLIPYIYSNAYDYHKKGLPLIQPLYYGYPEIYDEVEYRNEYMFGTELLICPITNQKDKVMDRVIKRIFLPKGVWYDFNTGKKFYHNKRYITFYKDEDYPIFAKAGAIIPMSKTNKNVNSINNPDVLDIHIFPGKNGSFELYEDDGISKLYEEGYFIITSIDYKYEENNYNVVIRPLAGKTNIIPNKRTYNIIFRNTNETDNIKVNITGEKLSENQVISEKANNNFIITVKDVDTTKELNVQISGEKLEIEAGRIINEDINSIISDLKIPTNVKESLARICFSNIDVKRKRIEIRKLRRKGLSSLFIKMFMKLYDYLDEN